MKTTEKKMELIRKVLDIEHDKIFALGVISQIKTDDEAQSMIDYLDSNEWNSLSDITLKAFLFTYKREQEK